MVKSYIAFLDLLGTSDLASHDEDRYYESLMNFKEALVVYARDLSQNDQVFLFSDCAYVQSDSLKHLVKYTQKVRSYLLDLGYYLKGAISRGALSATNASHGEWITDQEVREAARRVRGHFFGKDVVRAYALQEVMKGIGLSVEPDVYAGNEKSGWFVASVHIPDMRSRVATPFYDLALVDDDRTYDVLYRLLENFFRIKTRSMRIGRYYITFLVSCVRSEHYGRMTDPAKRMRHEEDTVPPIARLILTGELEKYFGDVPGIENVYFAFIDKVIRDNSRTDVRTCAIDTVRRRRRYLKYLGSTSAHILAPENRKVLLSDLSPSFQPDLDEPVS